VNSVFLKIFFEKFHGGWMRAMRKQNRTF